MFIASLFAIAVRPTDFAQVITTMLIDSSSLLPQLLAGDSVSVSDSDLPIRVAVDSEVVVQDYSLIVTLPSRFLVSEIKLAAESSAKDH